jgi:hypothetical protein
MGQQMADKQMDAASQLSALQQPSADGAKQ